MHSHISVVGARVNNLKNVSVKIPKNKLTVITGLSGSGKSSLAFDTIYAEGQRRYAESLNAYARQFMDVQDKPDVDEITGLSPTIAIDQRNTSTNPRSTVGTVTEIYDYLRLLFARIGKQYDPRTGDVISSYKPGEIVEFVRKAARASSEVHLLAPLLKQAEVEQRALLRELESSGYENVRLNGVPMDMRALKSYKFQKGKKYDVEILVTKITNAKSTQLLSDVEKVLDLGNGAVVVADEDSGVETIYTTFPFNPDTGEQFNAIEPRTFSFNSPYGACPRCTGLGYTLNVDEESVIPNPRLTLAEGAIQPWTRIVGNQSQYQKLLAAVAEAHGFSVDTPVNDLPKKVMDLVLYGTDGQTYQIGSKTMHYEGVIPNLTNRHAETDSDYIRKEIEVYMKESTCPVCAGKRLRQESLYVRIGDVSIADISSMTIEEAHNFFEASKAKGENKKAVNNKFTFTKDDLIIAEPILKEINGRISDLMKVGLYYLSLDRSFATLSGGEAQRIRLAGQLSTGLTDVIYILDEPSIGLHSRDSDKLIETLKTLRDLGNTVIVVEHDEAMIEAADYVIDVGPGA